MNGLFMTPVPHVSNLASTGVFPSILIHILALTTVLEKLPPKQLLVRLSLIESLAFPVLVPRFSASPVLSDCGHTFILSFLDIKTQFIPQKLKLPPIQCGSHRMEPQLL